MFNLKTMRIENILEEKQVEIFGVVETKARFDQYKEMKSLLCEEWEMEHNEEKEEDTCV